MKKEHLKKAAALSMAVMMAAGSLVIPGTTAKAASEIDHSEEITITMMTTEAGTQKFPTEGYVYDVIKEKFNINLEVQPIRPATTTPRFLPCWLPDRCRTSSAVFSLRNC